MPCVAHLGEVARNYPAFEAAGIAVFGIVQAPPAVLALFLKNEPQPFPIVADPDRASYKAFGLGRVSVWHFLRPRILFNFIKLLFRGERIRKLTHTEDVFQLGGDFALDRNATLVYAYPSKDATDRPRIMDLIQKLQTKD